MRVTPVGCTRACAEILRHDVLKEKKRKERYVQRHLGIRVSGEPSNVWLNICRRKCLPPPIEYSKVRHQATHLRSLCPICSPCTSSDGKASWSDNDVRQHFRDEVRKVNHTRVYLRKSEVPLFLPLSESPRYQHLSAYSNDSWTTILPKQ